MGTMSQFRSEDSVQALLDGGGNDELKTLIEREKIKSLIGKGYKAIGAFICNQPLDANGQEFVVQSENIVVYDRARLAREFIDIEHEGGIEGTFTFDAGYVKPMTIQTNHRATTYLLPVQALELVQMDGIDDGTLFSQNVRQALGNTKVNRELRQSILDKDEHSNFPLYHNGVNILCKEAKYENDKINITDYVVVNGAQSISVFKRSAAHLSADLRVIAKIIEINDTELAREITVNSNNQNAIKARDLKSTNEIQIRLRNEFEHVEGGRFDLEIKRGQESRPGATVITNEEAGRLLLAFDLNEPEACHQIYRLFDDKYAEIFARPAVTALRIIFLHLIMEQVREAAERIRYQPLARYGLTRFFLMSVVAELMRNDDIGRELAKNPERLFREGRVEKICASIQGALESIVIDLNYEVNEKGEAFDYKADLKSPSRIKELRNTLLRSYDKDLARGKAAKICGS